MAKNISGTCCLTLFMLLSIATAHAQPGGAAAIDEALSEQRITDAQRILNERTAFFIKQKQADSLVDYVFYAGKVARAASGADAAEKKVSALLLQITMLTDNPAIRRQAAIEAGEFLSSIGRNTAAYRMNIEARKYTSEMPDKTNADLALIENNLATLAQRMGNIEISEQHQRNGLRHLLSAQNKDYEKLYVAYNGMGSLMWYASRTDSALYYYKKALDMLEMTERSARNKYFRPAIVLNNLAGLYQVQGKSTEAIRALEHTIHNLKMFVSNSEGDNKKTTAITFQLEATDNLAGIYKEVGDLRKAQSLLEYSYEQKQTLLSADDPALFISQILLGQLYYAQRAYDKAAHFLQTGLKNIAQSDGDYLFWQGDACYTLAQIYDAQQNVDQAAAFFEKAEQLYEASFQGEYDHIFLEFLRNAALFYAEHGLTKAAIAKAKKGYDYVAQSQGTNSLTGFYQLLNLSEVYARSGQFTESEMFGNQGLSIVNRLISGSGNLLDSVRMESKKPRAILARERARYHLLSSKDSSTLKDMLHHLNEALASLERHKLLLHDPRDISILIADNNDLIEFIKKITLDLFQITGKESYLEQLVALHESKMYYRIRSRLDRSDSLQFVNFPAQLQEKEKTLRNALATALAENGSHDEKMHRYVSAIKEWDDYQTKIRKEYPEYYALRYAPLFKKGVRITELIPPGQSVIRYFFVDQSLFCLVADQHERHLIKVDLQGVQKDIHELTEKSIDPIATGEILHNLYLKLWAPISKKVRHKKVVIIPEGILYHLNFEILTPQKVKSFKELATKSLLATHTVSYNYSLFLLHKKPAHRNLKNNFVAFAPGFSDKIKKDYARSLPGEPDKGYLALLPQPFSIALAMKVGKMIGGKLFVHEKATKGNFKSQAGNHGVIHIGTHAESNDDHPQFSRLIFAKNAASGEHENLLHVNEIYNYDLRADLAVLTACETGKPGHQDGEGMISLAHAFNYAGSQSIITGLWKIDEQASTHILEHFYRYLLDGMEKDEALRLAKLDYLQAANGRMLAPQYWAGLVILGDTKPVAFKPRSGQALLLGAIAAVLVATLALFYLRRAKRSKRST